MKKSKFKVGDYVEIHGDQVSGYDGARGWITQVHTEEGIYKDYNNVVFDGEVIDNRGHSVYADVFLDEELRLYRIKSTKLSRKIYPKWVEKDGWLYPKPRKIFKKVR